mgnify:CR=1 FL=1
MKKPNAARPPLSGRKVLVGVCGGIAAYKACELVRRLTKAGAEVRVVMTRAAREFVAPLTFRTLSRAPVVSELFDSPPEFDPVHISLAEWADVVLIAPATANVIGKIACGIADDLLSCTVMAARPPVVVAPAMNEAMWRSAAVRRNVALLKRRGFLIVGPEEGRLACGSEGPGRLAEVDELYKAVERLV